MPTTPVSAPRGTSRGHGHFPVNDTGHTGSVSRPTARAHSAVSCCPLGRGVFGSAAGSTTKLPSPPRVLSSTASTPGLACVSLRAAVRGQGHTAAANLTASRRLRPCITLRVSLHWHLPSSLDRHPHTASVHSIAEGWRRLHGAMLLFPAPAGFLKVETGPYGFY